MVTVTVLVGRGGVPGCMGYGSRCRILVGTRGMGPGVQIAVSEAKQPLLG